MSSKTSSTLTRGALGATALAALLALGAGNASAQISDDVVRVGIQGDMSGPYSGNGGPGSVLAARMAVEDFGGKVNGKNIEVLISDDQNKPDVGLNAARKWLDSDKVDAIIGGSASSIALGVQTLMKEKQKPYLIAGTVSSDLTGKACSPMAIQFLVDTYALPKAGVQGLINEGAKTFFFVTVDYAFGAALQSEATRFIEAAGGKVDGLGEAPAGRDRLFLLPAAGAGQRRQGHRDPERRRGPVQRAQAGGGVQDRQGWAGGQRLRHDDQQRHRDGPGRGRRPEHHRALVLGQG
jgi:branched-chain amino acid transport system substrate-binding protein